MRRSKQLPITVLLVMLGAASALLASGAGARPKAAGAKPIVLGVVAGLTGGGDTIGVPWLAGSRLAVAEINKAGGIKGRPVKLVVEDSQTQAVQAVQASLKLVSSDHVNAVLCSCYSSAIFPIANALAKRNVVIINNAASAPSVRKLPGHIVTTMPLDDVLGTALAKWVYGRGNHSAGLVTVNDQYGTDFGKIVASTYKKVGGVLSTSQYVNPNLPDYSPEMQRIADSKATVLFTGTYTNDLRLQFKELTQLGWQGSIFNLYPSATQLDQDPAANKRVFGIEPTWRENDPNAKGWAQRYKKLTGKTPDYWAAVGYDAAELAARGVANATSSKATDVQAAIRAATTKYSGPTGPIQLDSSFVRKNPNLAYFTLSGGKYVRITK